VALFPLAIFLLKKFNVMDQPDLRKIHKIPVPRMGGVVIYIAFVLPMLLLWNFSNPQKGIIIGAGIALLIGMADDLWGVPAYIKLIALFVLTLLIWRFGVITSLPFDKICCVSPMMSTFLNLIITMLWIAGICSSINALDHMDALAGGISICAAAAYLAVSLRTGQAFWGLMSIGLIGSLAGFLIYNRHPAKIFMGDSGSLCLGFSLAAIGIMGGWSQNPIKAIVVPVAILSLPIFDLAYVIISRRLDGTTKTIMESITYCGKDHIGHRLCKMGFSQMSAVRIIYLIAVTIAISALVIRNTDSLESFLLLLQIFLVYIILMIFMRIIPKNKEIL
jgi:UDP-GlcNAc:undecaprenyl-phosphate GlcNAc-1-phosphate transferase